LPIVLATILIWGTAQANELEIQQLRVALDANDLNAFVRELEAGVLEPDTFKQDVDAYDVACRSTSSDRAPFLERLLAFGVDPSMEDPEHVRYTFSLLTCAYRENGPANFELLLNAGADSNVSVCPECPDSWHTLVAHVLIMPELFDMIVERRELTPVELDSIALRVKVSHNKKVWKGQPLNEYYAAYLRERGYDVTPKGPRTNEEGD